jgi:hypothetical protein
LSFDHDLMTRVSETVQDRIGDDRIGEQSGPIGHRTVGGEDKTLGTEASIDKGIESFGRLLIDGLKAEVVN